MGLLLTIGGWLADAYLGRYRTVCYGMWTMWLGAMLNGLSLIIGKLVESYSHYGHPWVSLANIIPLGIDQLIDSSSTEIKSFIKWYTSGIQLLPLAMWGGGGGGGGGGVDVVFLMQALIVFVCFLVALVAVKMYKRRTRIS